MGPRQIMALSGGARKPMDISFTPYCSMGIKMFLPLTCLTLGCSFSQLNMVGIEGPKISASISPTLAPAFASATARFVVTVDLPTPPFPDAIATIFFTPGSNWALSRKDVTDDVTLICIRA